MNIVIMILTCAGLGVWPPSGSGLLSEVGGVSSSLSSPKGLVESANEEG